MYLQWDLWTKSILKDIQVVFSWNGWSNNAQIGAKIVFYI